MHRFICSENRENRGLPSLGDLCSEFITEDHRYYLNVVKWGTQPPWPEPMCTDSSAQRTERTGVFLRWGTYAESHLNGSYIMPEFCEVGYSASSHSITDVFLTAFHSIPSLDSASEAPLYLESEHEATDPKTSLRSAAQQNTQTQGDPAKLFLLISSEVPRATHVAVLQCLTAIVINSLQPCIPAQNFVHFLRLSQSAQSVPSSRFLAQTIIRCTKTSSLPLRGGFQALLSRCTSLPIISCSSVALSKCLQMMGQHRPTREGCWFCICLGHVQKSMALQPLSTTKACCASVAQ